MTSTEKKTHTQRHLAISFLVSTEMEVHKGDAHATAFVVVPLAFVQ